MMIAVEHKEIIERNHEPSLKCLIKEYPYSLQLNGPIEGFPELKDGVGARPSGNVAERDNSLSNESVESGDELKKKPIYRNDFASWSTLQPTSNNVHQHQMNVFESQFYPFPCDNHIQHIPFSYLPHGYPYESRFQEFQYFVVIDFEATCDKGKNPHPQEIIEFPAVIVSSTTGRLESHFQTYVRPTCNQQLSDFCKDLTGIQQVQVDSGLTLSEALLQHDKWLESKGIKNTNFAVVTWSNWDCRVMLESECRYKKIRKPPYFNRWINLKIPFHEVFGGARCNLKEAVQMAGLNWQGREHCGLDDAKNTARLLALLMHKGFKLSITSSLMHEPAVPRKQHHHHHHLPFAAAPPPPRKVMVLQVPNPPIQFHHHNHNHHPCCYCGVKSSKVMIRKPGPKQGNCFFGCGNWTATRGSRCQYFEWASSP